MLAGDEIINIITNGYKDILKRDPDPEGLKSYIKEFQKGLTVDIFHEILKTSKEYIEKFGKDTSCTISYCMIGTDRLHEIKSYIEIVIPYIDRFIFIDGSSTDKTVEFLKSLNDKYNNKIEVYIYEWQDKFAVQRNNYLKHFADKQINGWILVSDTDEHYTIDTLSKLRNIIKDAEIEGYNGIQFQVEDIMTDDDDQNKILSKNTRKYWKPLLFKYYPNIRYEGESHEILVGYPIRWKQTNLICQHFTSKRRIYEKNIENFFISDSNRYSEKWAEFRELCRKSDINKYKEFLKLYNKGDLSKEIEDWIYKHRNDNDHIEDSEIKGMALYYEVLHPNKKR